MTSRIFAYSPNYTFNLTTKQLNVNDAMATPGAEKVVLEKFAQIIAIKTGKTPQEILKTTLPSALTFFALDMFTRGGLSSLGEVKDGDGEPAMTALSKALDSLKTLYGIE